jgi:hypothetical protein
MLTKLIFVLYLWTGTVTPQDEHEGRKTYAIFMEDGTCIDYAYTAEVYNWIETGSFQYDETLEDKVTSEDKIALKD